MQPLFLILVILLFLTAFIGGGLNIREFKLYKASTGVRITAILSSLILLLVGSAFQQPKRANFRVTNNLTPGAIRERVVLTVQGKEIGSIISISSAPESTEEYTVPKAGEYSYALELFGVYNDNGQEASFYGKGGGLINVDTGDAFEVQGDVSNNPITVTLVEK